MISIKLYIKLRKLIKTWNENDKMPFEESNIMLANFSPKIINKTFSKREIYFLEEKGYLKILNKIDYGNQWGIIFEPTYKCEEYNVVKYILSLFKYPIDSFINLLIRQ